MILTHSYYDDHSVNKNFYGRKSLVSDYNKLAYCMGKKETSCSALTKKLKTKIKLCKRNTKKNYLLIKLVFLFSTQNSNKKTEGKHKKQKLTAKSRSFFQTLDIVLE